MKLESITVQDLLNVADFIYLALDLNREVVLINRKGCEILGYSEEEILGKKWFDNFLPKRIAKEMKKSFIQRIEEKTELKTSGVNPILTKQGEERIIGWQNTYIKDEEGNISGVLSSGMDITDEMTIRENLEEREGMLNSIIENSPFGFVAFKGEDNIVITNPALEEMLGYTHKELQEKTLNGITHSEDRKIAIEMYKKAKAREITSATYEKRYIRKDGSMVDARILTWGTYDDKGEMIYNFGTIEDITAEKQAEKKIKESENKFQNVFDSSPFGMHLYELKDDGKLIFSGFNKAADEILGVENKSFLGKTCEDAFPDLSYSEIPQRYRKTAKEGISWRTDQIGYDEGGISGAFEVQTFQTSPNVMIAAFQDVTERLQMQEQITKERDFSKNILDIAGVMFVLVNKDEKIELINKKITEILGYPEEELIGHNWFETIFPKDEWNELKKNFHDIVNGVREPTEYIEREIITKGGEKKLIAFRNVQIRNQYGEITHMLGSGLDITEQKKAEEGLQKSEQKFRGVFENAGDGFIILETDGTIIDANNSLIKSSGYKKQELVGKNILDIGPYVDQEFLSTVLNRLGKEKQMSFETLAKRKDGSVLDVEVSASVFKLGEKEVIFAINRDITERKRMEEEIKLSEERYRTIFEVSGSALGIVDKEGIYTFINPKGEELYGLSREQLEGKKHWTEFLPEEVFEEITEISRKRAIDPDSVPAQYESKIRDSKGNIRDIIVDVRIIPDTEERIASLIDITDFKKTEKSLRESEEKFRSVFNYSNDGYLLTDSDGTIVDINPTLLEFLGYSRSELINKSLQDFDYIVEREADSLFAETITKEGYSYLETKIKRKDGSKFPVDLYARRLEIAEEEVVFTIVRDLTHRKKTEEKLKESEERFRSVFNHSNDGYLLNETDGTILDINPALVEFLGYNKSEVIGKNLQDFDYIVERDADALFAETITKEGHSYLETNIKRKDGSIVPADLHARRIDLAGREVVFTVIRDLTLRKKAEEELKLSENLYRTIFEVSGAALSIANENSILQLVNTKCEELFGYSKDEMENKKNWREFLHKNELERVSEISDRRRIDPDSVPSQYESKVVDRNGNVKDVIVDVRLIPGSKNSIASLVDITEMKKTERALMESETKFKSIFNNSHDGYILRTIDGEILEINSSIIGIFGYTEEDVTSGNITEFQPYESQEELLQIMREIETKGYAHYETQARKKDGTIFPIEVKSFKFFIGMEEVILGIIRDISLRKETERILIESKTKLRNLVENIPIAISTMSSAGDIIAINPAHWKLFGYETREEFIQTVPSDHWINMKDREKLYALLKKEKDIKDFSIKLRKRDGSAFWGSVSAISYKDESGETIYYQILQDITTQKEMEDELRNQVMKYKLEEANLYVAEEEIAYTSVEAFKDLLKVGYEGVIFSRTPEDKWKENLDVDFSFFKLAEKGRGKIIPPDLEKIEQIIEELPNRQVILLDRLDYLIQKNGFENTLFSIYRLTDIAYLANHILLLSIDSSLLSTKERNLLQKELKPIETKIEGMIPEDLFEVLMYIYQQNLTGGKPTNSDVIEELNISRPTARKRIQNLIDEGYIMEAVKGRSKVLQITQRGKMIF